MTTNQCQQNNSINLSDDYLSTLLTGRVMEFPVDLTKIFNSELFKTSAIISNGVASNSLQYCAEFNKPCSQYASRSCRQENSCSMTVVARIFK